MKKNSKKVIDLLSDPDFRQWVANPSRPQDIYWQKWITSHPEHQEAVYRAKEVILRMKFKEDKLSHIEREEILDNIIASSFLTNRKRTLVIGYPWLKIAAAIALLIVIGLLAFFKETTFADSEIAEIEQQAKEITKQNGKGIKSQIVLPDGTKVFLNSESQLIYPAHFDNHKRQVQLTGEAFFEVAHDSLRPFSVMAKNTLTTALGTSFNVQAFASDNNINVALVTGSVKVASQNKQLGNLKLNPGEKIMLDLRRDKAFVTKFNLQTEIGWKDGLLVFNNSGFPDFIQKIERWFGVEVEIEGKPKTQWNIDGQFDNESLEEILNSIKYTHEVKYEINDKKVKIEFD